MTKELFIEFDGQQLAVLTDIPALRDFFERRYQFMLVPRMTSAAGRLEVLRTGTGCVIKGITTIEIDDERSFGAVTDFLRQDVLAQFVKARPDLLWVHGAAVESKGSALLIVGPSGQGKSALSTRLCSAGWLLMSDDIAPVRMDSNEVLAFNQTADRRRSEERQLTPNEMAKLDKEQVVIPLELLRREPATIRGIVFPVFAYGADSSLSLRTAGESALELLRNCTNFADHKEAVIDRVASLARSVPAYELAYGDADDATRTLATLCARILFPYTDTRV